MALLLTGGSGLLGQKLTQFLPNFLSPTHETLDITDKNMISKYIEENNVDKIIHTAAITSIRKCDDDKTLAWSVNVEGTQNLLSVLKEHTKNGYFAYVSTPCVFRGDDKMYNEQSIPDPVNFYGFTKSVGENIVKTFNNSLIVRTNFVAKKSWPYEKAFTDRFGNYLFSDDVAQIFSQLLSSKITGIRHIVGNQILSMYDLAKLTTPNIQSMTMNEYVGPHLTKNMTMDSTYLNKYKISSI
jgi:dTDP-4-dehydrorhamnose reductase